MPRLTRHDDKAPGRSRRRLAVALGIAAATALVPAFALAHVERASYWPDPAAETVDGQQVGGAVPGIRDLYTALDPSAVGDTRVVCEGGQSVPYRADLQVGKRTDLDVSRARVVRLKRKLRRLHGQPGKKRQAHRVKRRLKKAKADYRAALAAEQNARQKGSTDYQQANDAEQAARKQYQAQLGTQPSIQALDAGIAAAQANGYKLRASQPAIHPSPEELARLRDFNAQLLADCDYDSIQAAVNDSGNNDRVVIMPGTYTEPDSRAAPSPDPTCDGLQETNDRGDTGALSYRYQFHCPNDQNLIAVMGREPAKDGGGNEVEPPQPPSLDRHVIPDAGPCVRCNLQIEGSGVSPDDVIIDGGDPSIGDHSPPGADQNHYAKDVGIRADRADGFVLNNLKVRHVNEHDVYVPETDGFNLNRLKTTYAGEYGVLTYVADHSLIHNCDSWGHGDSALYPGASADTWDAVPEADRRRSNEIRDCDMHHSALGYSGTDGNAVWVHNNELYDNTQGFSTDVFTAPGHPGFPQDSDLIEGNDFYDNNFNSYLPPCGAGESPGPAVAGQSPSAPGGNCTDVTPTVPVPVGVGMWIAGGNHNITQNNHFWNNWKRGTMLFAVPDQLVCGPGGSVDPSLLAGCNPGAVPPSTSYNNEFRDNVMGQTPDGTADPNGTDFWWDEFTGNTGNCWHDNVGPDGTRDSLTAEPPINPVPGASSLPAAVPFFLPEDCGTSVGTSGASQDSELVSCLANFQEGAMTPCTWFTTPAEPAP